MRILGVSTHLYLGDIYLSLIREGFDVRVFVPPEAVRAYDGIIAPTHDLDAALGWVGRDGIVMVEGTARGAQQDTWRAAGYRVVGGSAFGDRLENDRAFGQAVLRRAGLPIMPAHDFASAAAAAAWLSEKPGAYVAKWDGGARATFVGAHPEGADLAYMLGQPGHGRVLLQRRADGTEVGVGAYFDGRAFLRPACIDFEHKRFFNGDMGEMTGEMGTLASYDGADALFDATLARVAPMLAEAGHVGYVNLNCIVDDAGIWPLEFTTRFSNPGFAVLAALQPDGWGDLLVRMADGANEFRHTPGWCVCIVLTMPPFPNSTAAAPEEDPPMFFRTPVTEAERASYRFIDMRDDGILRAHRRSGHVMVVTGTGLTVEAAQAAARARADNVIVPELRYRTDIGARFLARDHAYLRGRGLL